MTSLELPMNGEPDEEPDDDDEAPETPTDEPEPIPVQDPPVEDRPPMTV